MHPVMHHQSRTKRSDLCSTAHRTHIIHTHRTRTQYTRGAHGSLHVFALFWSESKTHRIFIIYTIHLWSHKTYIIFTFLRCMRPLSHRAPGEAFHELHIFHLYRITAFRDFGARGGRTEANRIWTLQKFQWVWVKVLLNFNWIPNYLYLKLMLNIWIYIQSTDFNLVVC